jgi:hypothetical protein
VRKGSEATRRARSGGGDGLTREVVPCILELQLLM